VFSARDLAMRVKTTEKQIIEFDEPARQNADGSSYRLCIPPRHWVVGWFRLTRSHACLPREALAQV
jgi:hypothetical protein